MSRWRSELNLEPVAVADEDPLTRGGDRCQFLVDTLAELPTQASGGDRAFCLADNSTWVRNDSNQWVEVGGSGAHPDLATHDALGLATDAELTTHEATSHGVTDHGVLTGLADDDHSQYALDSDLTTHAGAADPHSGYLTPAEHTSGLSGHHTSFVQADHDGLPNPHHSNANDHTAAHAIDSANHTGVLADAQIPATIARDSELPDLAGHVAAADPHTGYQRETEKGAASGYASLGADTLVPQDQLGTGAQDGTKFLRDDGTWQAAGGAHPDLATHDALGLATDSELTTHAGAADPHTGYRLESADHTHQSAGAQAGTLAEAALALTDITTNDASLTKHGFLQKLPGGTATFLRADGTFAAPTAAASDPVYSPGSFTVVTETGRYIPARLKLATTARATIEGTGRLVIT